VASSLRLDSVEFYSNTATNGGALWMQSTQMLARAVWFQLNGASGQGRAVYIEKSTVAEVRSGYFAANQTIYGAKDTAHNAIVLNNCGPFAADQTSFELPAPPLESNNSFLVYDWRTANALHLPKLLATTHTRLAKANEDKLCSNTSDTSWRYKAKSEVCQCNPGRFATQLDVIIWDSSKHAYLPPNDLECADCPGGYFQLQENQQACVPCARGHFQPAAGFSSCTECRTGMFSNLINSVTCELCPKGKFGSAGGQSFCEQVPSNKVLRVQESSDGKSTEIVLIGCSAGEIPGNSGLCEACPVGQVQPEGSNSACERCLSKQYIGFNGTTGETDQQHCNDCPRPGAICDGIIKAYDGNHWHDPSVLNPNASTNMYTCVNNGCPNKDAATMGCKSGYNGPLCALCSDGYFKSVRDCARCERVRIGQLVAFVLGALMFVALVLFLTRKYHRYLDRAATFSREFCIYL
jgi:hypothetical protein